MPEIKVGDVVALKSDLDGETRMTVVERTTTPNGGSVICVWFDKNTEMQESELPFAALTLINPPE